MVPARVAWLLGRDDETAEALSVRASFGGRLENAILLIFALSKSRHIGRREFEPFTIGAPLRKSSMPIGFDSRRIVSSY
jgi:hypothetical protein